MQRDLDQNTVNFTEQWITPKTEIIKPIIKGEEWGFKAFKQRDDERFEQKIIKDSFVQSPIKCEGNFLVNDQGANALINWSPIISDQISHFMRSCFKPLWEIYRTQSDQKESINSFINVSNSPQPPCSITFQNSRLDRNIQEHTKLVAPIPQYRQSVSIQADYNSSKNSMIQNDRDK